MADDGIAEWQFFAEDGTDRRQALLAAIQLAGYGSCTFEGCDSPERHTLHQADGFYAWLRNRASLRATSLVIVPGTPTPEGQPAMTFSLPDNDQVTFTLTGLDSKRAQVAAPEDTWNWSLSDPDSSGAVLTVSGDTTSATVNAGNPTENLVLNVTGANTGLTGSDAIVVTAGAAVSVGLVPGTPEAEAPPA